MYIELNNYVGRASQPLRTEGPDDLIDGEINFDIILPMRMLGSMVKIFCGRGRNCIQVILEVFWVG